ncbi:MAG: response regulator transcription factor [Bacteroidota bacterium]
MNMVKVFIVDDHYMVIEGIRVLLQHEPGITFCGAASSAESCMAFLLTELPDVILMDINLPGVNGIELCQLVRLKYPSVFVIGLSTFNQLSYIRKMMENGASGYLLKNAGREELTGAIIKVARGQEFMSSEVALILKHGNTSLLPLLTRREKEVLELIVEGCTNNEIARKLFIGISTVDTHRKNLLVKLNARNTAALVRISLDQKLL